MHLRGSWLTECGESHGVLLAQSRCRRRSYVQPATVVAPCGDFFVGRGAQHGYDLQVWQTPVMWTKAGFNDHASHSQMLR